MLPQIGLSEMLLLGMLALVVLGPRDLSLMMRRMGRWTGKLRAMAWEFRQSFDEIGRQAELEELRKEVQALKTNTGLEEVKRDIEKTDADIAREAGVMAAAARMKAKERPEDPDASSEDSSSEEDKQAPKPNTNKAPAGASKDAAE